MAAISSYPLKYYFICISTSLSVSIKYLHIRIEIIATNKDINPYKKLVLVSIITNVNIKDAIATTVNVTTKTNLIIILTIN